MQYFIILSLALSFFSCEGQVKVAEINVAKGWANNSVNVTIFRKNSLVTFGNTQYISYYDDSANVVVGKRNIHDKKWQLLRTGFKGNVNDAHDVISIMVGDLQRIKLYPEKGFQIPQSIPTEVWAAYESLVEAGYNRHLAPN